MNTHHSRRHFLTASGMNLTGALALAHLMGLEQGARADTGKPTFEKPVYNLLPKPAPKPPRAQAMISLWMQGGPSHLDLFDPKPELAKNHLKNHGGDIERDNAGEASPKLFASPWKFEPRGNCGMPLSELLPALASVCDDIALVRSMKTDVNNHGQSISALLTGRITPGRPVLGSWLTYALGTESQNLPAYCVLTDPGGVPVLGSDNWSNGWLPSLYQGTVIRPREPRIVNLEPPAELRGIPQRKLLTLLDDLNAQHLATHPGEHDLSSRIASYELAARMQTAAKEALDISSEPASIKSLYGIDDPASREYGTRCLIARRLIERGVRFVHVCTGNQEWDHHGSIEKALPNTCKKVDKPSAALVRDLKQRGLLDTTIVHWGGEMGRLPVIQNEKNIGRDHNTHGFTHWLAGGGFKGGIIHGATDEIGYKAVENIVNHSDLHATLLHLFGFEPQSLTFQRPTGPGSLIDGQPARIVSELLA